MQFTMCTIFLKDTNHDVQPMHTSISSILILPEVEIAHLLDLYPNEPYVRVMVPTWSSSIVIWISHLLTTSDNVLAFFKLADMLDISTWRSITGIKS
jgi:hypothetical protein